MTETNQQHNKDFVLLFSCLLLGIVFDFLFFDKMIGISYPIFWFVLYGSFFYIFRDKIKFEKRFEWFLMIPILLLLLTFLLFSAQEFQALNTLIVPVLFVIQTILLTKNNKHPWYKTIFISELFLKIFRTIPNVKIPFKLINQSIKSKTKNTTITTLGKICIGLLISLPIVAVILGILTSADSIFNYWVSQIPDWFGDIDFGTIPGQLALILVVFFLLFIYLWSLLHPNQKEENVFITEEEKDPMRIDGIISLTILLIIDLVYLLFTAIQVSYLFGKAKLLLPKGVTYAQYATQGFNQLVTVTVINILIVLAFIYLVKKAQPMIYRTVQILLSLLTFCTGFILFSAFFKLSLYEQVYGFTYTRILVHSFMILLLILFLVALIKTWKNGISLMKYYTVIVLIWYVTLNYINIDHIIAEQNVNRYLQNKIVFVSHQTDSYDRYGETDYVDISYLELLSYDVVPQLLKLREDKNLKPTVDMQLKQMKHDLAQEKDWQSFNLSKHRARQLLKNVK